MYSDISYFRTKGFKGVNIDLEGRCFRNEMISQLTPPYRDIYEDTFLAHNAQNGYSALR